MDLDNQLELLVKINGEYRIYSKVTESPKGCFFGEYVLEKVTQGSLIEERPRRSIPAIRGGEKSLRLGPKTVQTDVGWGALAPNTVDNLTALIAPSQRKRCRIRKELFVYLASSHRIDGTRTREDLGLLLTVHVSTIRLLL